MTALTINSNFKDLVFVFVDLIMAVIPVVAGLALFAFFLGLVRFVLSLNGNAKGVEEGKALMIWGTVALFVMVSVWGILRFLHGEANFSGAFGLPLLPRP